jgi:hypothetical protein
LHIRTLTATFALAVALGPLAPAAGAASVAPPPVPPAGSAADSTSGSAADSPICWYGACYDYVYGQQTTETTGISVLMKIADPRLNPADGDGHSLQEISLQNSDQTSTVEIGWTVDDGLNGDYLPHLFVYHWVDGQESCYNGCGFVQVSHRVQPGMALYANEAARFAIREVRGDWWVYFGNEAVGYFPGSLWGGTYTKAQLVSAFGEVAQSTTDVPSCTAMGNGRFGSSPASSWIRDYRIYDSPDAPDLTVRETSPDHYDYGKVTATSFNLGGPGTGPC